MRVCICVHIVCMHVYTCMYTHAHGCVYTCVEYIGVQPTHVCIHGIPAPQKTLNWLLMVTTALVHPPLQQPQYTPSMTSDLITGANVVDLCYPLRKYIRTHFEGELSAAHYSN